MQPNSLGIRLREIRISSEMGPIKSACEAMGISHETLRTYETGNRLPDVDFLAVFAAKTGGDFYELLRLRLQDSEEPDARRLAEQPLQAPQPAASFDRQLLLDCIAGAIYIINYNRMTFSPEDVAKVVLNAYEKLHAERNGLKISRLVEEIYATEKAREDRRRDGDEGTENDP
ncbi:MAG: helix-turn-helix transcriptional regulator [Methylotetracoccus sp.]